MGKTTDRIDTIWQVLLALGQNDSAEQALTEAMDVIRGEIGIGEMTLWLYNDSEKRITAVAHAGDSSVVGYSTDPDSSLVGSVFSSGEEIWIPAAASDRHFPSGSDEVTGVHTKNCYIVPLLRARKTIGCVQAINHAGTEYSAEEKAILRNFCGLAAMAIEEKGLTFKSRGAQRSLLSLRNAVKDYPSGTGTQRVLKGVNLDIYEHEFLVVLGESGCGKSTMLNILGGMDALTEGEMMVDGRDFSHPSEDDLTEYRRDVIGFIFQSYNLMPNLTALENIEFVAENTPVHGNPQDALAMVGLADVADHYPSMMSGGQQQRVAIARAIVKKPRIILADEPTGALDFATGQDVLRVIEKLVREEKTTVVMVTHNAEIAKMADRVIRMRDGKIGSIQENARPRSADELLW